MWGKFWHYVSDLSAYPVRICYNETLLCQLALNLNCVYSVTWRYWINLSGLSASKAMLLDKCRSTGRKAGDSRKGLFTTTWTREKKLAKIKRTPQADFPARFQNRCLSNHQAVTRTKRNFSSEKNYAPLQAYVLNQSHTTLASSIDLRLHVSAPILSHYQAFYKPWYRKNYILQSYNRSYAIQYNFFSCIKVYKRPDDGSQLQPKHVAVNKLIKLLLRTI